MNSELDPKSSQLAAQPQTSPLMVKQGWLRRVSRRLSIGQKISYGYAIALGVAVIGTTAGFVVGDRFQHAALERHNRAEEEVRLLHRLQASILQARTHQQQLIPLTEDLPALRDEYEHFLVHAAEIKRLWASVATHAQQLEYQADGHQEGIPELLETYQGVPEAYFQQANQLLEPTTQANVLPAQLQALQQQLLSFTNSAIALRFDGVSDDLVDIINTSYEEASQAKATLLSWETIRIQIIAGSILLSSLIGGLLAFYTSRAITKPIKWVTTVAQRTVQTSNFDLQAPVTTEDEIGILAASFNQLTQRVKMLLEEQQAAALQQQQMQETQLIQSEKMSSLGRMVAGVAHEINNPVNFIYGNLEHANTYVDDLLALIDTYQREVPQPPSAVQAQTEEIDLEFLQEDLPKLLQSMKMGSDRVRQIVLSLKNFSRLDESEVHAVDLHACLDSTLLILGSRIKKGITVTRNYGAVPNIEGYSGLLYQVFMNLLSNAIDALEEQPDTNSPKQLIITTEQTDPNWVVIRFQDNGSGMDADTQHKIFEAFFTTKPRGIGTGLGLSISRQIVEEKHHGQLACCSEMGQGTTFVITLPVKLTNSLPKTTAKSDRPKPAFLT
ncbi:ATP-binding protein [Trichocoleus sp. FACHB-262]|uniref:ATP-binding protein n=1 Tax=Trichocoleus sp. FACHB-262 TaxID=2692869 RepID=UPI001F5561F1|nr:ATP-binding protein [Trichocoleus sp. FACHB-262]